MVKPVPLKTKQITTTKSSKSIERNIHIVTKDVDYQGGINIKTANTTQITKASQMNPRKSTRSIYHE